jgi:enoyl-CoA hydratase/carnithine racemase
MFLGGRYIAADALKMGLVNAVLPDDALEKHTTEILQTLSDNAPLAIANSKTIIEEYAKSEGVPDQARMRASMQRCTESADYKEGRRAFMEKRKPRFQGK